MLRVCIPPVGKMIGKVIWFKGISTVEGYLMPIPAYIYIYISRYYVISTIVQYELSHQMANNFNGELVI